MMYNENISPTTPTLGAGAKNNIPVLSSINSIKASKRPCDTAVHVNSFCCYPESFKKTSHLISKHNFSYSKSINIFVCVRACARVHSFILIMACFCNMVDQVESKELSFPKGINLYNLLLCAPMGSTRLFCALSWCTCGHARTSASVHNIRLCPCQINMCFI